jgi:hypothetical protein
MSGGHQWAPETVLIVAWILGNSGSSKGVNLRGFGRRKRMMRGEKTGVSNTKKNGNA